MSESENEKFGTFASREAREYNAPSDVVPREAMWAAIAAARATRHTGIATGVDVRARRPYQFAWVAAALAATLVVGVAIGRYGRGVTLAPTGAAMDSAVLTRQAAASDRDAGSFGVAAIDHLARAEALLTTYEASRGDTSGDVQLAPWARDVLSDTRLLLDSPAGTDPMRRRLLADLEIVLVQLVQRAPPDGVKDERSHITRTLERTHVLTRLRSAQRRAPYYGT